MRLEYLIDYVQSALDDSAVHFTQSGVSTAINDANKLVGLFTLYFERTGRGQSWTVSTSYPGHVALPADCLVPLYVRDATSGKRIYPATFEELSLEDSSWWNTTGTRVKYYALWNPLRPLTHRTHGYQRFSIVVYPQVTSLLLDMRYAALPPTIQTNTSHNTIPEGFDLMLGDYAVFIGLIRTSGRVEQAVEYLKRFFDGVMKLNNHLQSRYPGGVDFQPPNVEVLLKAIAPTLGREPQGDRNRAS